MKGESSSPPIIVAMRLLMFSRFIMSETPTAKKSFATELPDVDEYLPAEIISLDQRVMADVESSDRDRVSAFDSRTTGSFGREVQAAYLHTSVQEAMCIEESSAAMTRLRFLDSKLRDFFGSITCQSSTTWGSYCGSIAFTIGYTLPTVLRSPTLTLSSALFDLHEFVLQRPNFYELHETSRAALSATVRMVVDVARSFNQRAPQINVETLPPRCLHLARAAQNLLGMPDNVMYEGSEAGLSEILTMLSCLKRRWRMAGRYLCHHSINLN